LDIVFLAEAGRNIDVRLVVTGNRINPVNGVEEVPLVTQIGSDPIQAGCVAGVSMVKTGAALKRGFAAGMPLARQ